MAKAGCWLLFIKMHVAFLWSKNLPLKSFVPEFLRILIPEEDQLDQFSFQGNCPPIPHLS